MLGARSQVASNILFHWMELNVSWNSKNSLSWNAMLHVSPGLFGSKVWKVIPSVCIVGDITADFTVSSSFCVRAGLSVVIEECFNWLLPIGGQLDRIGTGNFLSIEYGQCWCNIMRCKLAWNVFFQVDNKWCTHFLLQYAALFCTNGFSCRLLKVIVGIQKFQNPVYCWNNGIIQWDENCIYCTREEILDRSSCLLGVFCWAWPLVARCSPVDTCRWLLEILVAAVKDNNQRSVACLYCFHTSCASRVSNGLITFSSHHQEHTKSLSAIPPFLECSESTSREWSMWYKHAFPLLLLLAACMQTNGCMWHWQWTNNVCGACFFSLAWTPVLLPEKVAAPSNPSYYIAILKVFVFETLDKSCMYALSIWLFKGTTSKKHSTWVQFSSQPQKIYKSSSVMIFVFSSANTLRNDFFKVSSKQTLQPMLRVLW